MMGRITGGVVLLHGHTGHRFAMLPLARALEARGFVAVRIGYPSRQRSLAELADGIDAQVRAFAASFDGPLHFVGHSFGGLMIRAYIARARPAQLGRCVMIGTPNEGSEVADWLRTLGLDARVLGPAAAHLVTRRSDADTALLGRVDYPLGVIAGTRPLMPRLSGRFLAAPHDGKVTVASTHVAGEAGHVCVDAPHMLLTYQRIVIAQTVAFLQMGRFS